MTNKARDMLHSCICSAGFTVRGICKRLGIAAKTYYSKLDGTTDWKLGEVIKLRELLELSDSELLAIFFANEVA